MIIGVITALAGVTLELMTRGWIYPVPDYDPTPPGSALVLTGLVAGLLILGAGLGLRRHGVRDPPLEPTV